MDHSFAMDNYTAERYVLDELDEVERDAYEEHFFSCPACAGEIKSATQFVETARQVIQNELKVAIFGQAARRLVWGSWLKNWRIMLQPFPAAACLLLMAVTGLTVYQNGVTIPQLARKANSAQPQAAVLAQLTVANPFVLSEARSGPLPTVNVPKNRAFTLQFEIFDRNFDSYLAAIPTAPGTQEIQMQFSKQDAASPILMNIRGGVLKSGRYDVVIRGLAGGAPAKGEVDHFSFELNVQD